ncbi:MAG: uroporphyrinogen decarboxylase [Burkholderiaceae bacterium]
MPSNRLANDTFLRALMRQPVDHTPVWLMRQAGRYLPEYLVTRKKAGSFLGLAKTPDYATEVTLQPLDRYDLDAAILFSDILTVPDAMGLGLRFVEGDGPQFERPVRTEADVAKLVVPSRESLQYVYDATSQIRRALVRADGLQRVPLIGFSGSPWTLACYMIEGRSSRDFLTIKTMLYKRPDLLARLLDVTARAVVDYLTAQIEAGAQAVMLFDTWGGVLSHTGYRRWSLAYMQQIIDRLPRTHDGNRVPIVIFTKGGGAWVDDIAATGVDAIGLDWTADPAAARAAVGQRCALQGNLDPAVLLGGDDAIRSEVAKVLQAFDSPATPGHVFNLGHGISQFTPPDAVTTVIETVRALTSAPVAELAD